MDRQGIISMTMLLILVIIIMVLGLGAIIAVGHYSGGGMNFVCCAPVGIILLVLLLYGFRGQGGGQQVVYVPYGNGGRYG